MLGSKSSTGLVATLIGVPTLFAVGIIVYCCWGCKFKSGSRPIVGPKDEEAAPDWSSTNYKNNRQGHSKNIKAAYAIAMEI
jgi:hypothetical protein